MGQVENLSMNPNRAAKLAFTPLAAVLALTACTQTAATPSASTSATAAATASSSAATGASPSLEELTAQVKDSFKQDEYTDSKTGSKLPYNVYLPADYDKSKNYPVVVYIADSSLVGQDVTAPLSQYGALIWASDAEQAKHESIVIVPEYPEIILDDHGSYTMTDYVDLTGRFVSWLSTKYSIDSSRVYGTGQSMGCMTIMYLAAQNPDLFSAELFVSGQWDVSKLTGLEKEQFFYVAAGGDDKASGGQAEVKDMLKSAEVAYSEGTLDATQSETEQNAAVAKITAAGDEINFATFTTGTVMTANPGKQGEHMASFEPTYKIGALRDWLFAQSS